MPSTLKPVTAVKCPINEKLVSLDECEGCPNAIEVRIPWRHFAVRCKVGGESEGIYP